MSRGKKPLSVTQIIMQLVSTDNLLANDRKCFIGVLKESICESTIGAQKIFNEISVILKGRKSEIIKMRGLILLDYFFQRSKYFRETVCCHLRDLISSVSLRCDGNAKELIKNKIAMSLIEFVNTWDTIFGSFFSELHAIARYYRENIGIIGPNAEVYQ